MADHNDDLLDDDGLDGPAYEVDLADADEDALLADDYDDTPIHRKLVSIDRLPEEEDFIELGVEDDIAEDIRNDAIDNGSISFDNANDSDDEVKERSRFKTERNITLTPARPNKPIPETLDAVPVKTVVQPVRVRGGGHQQQNRRGGRGYGHFRGRGRGGGPHNFPPNFQHHQNFNNYQQQGPGGYYPPPEHQRYGPPPHQMPPPQSMPPGPPYHQQHPPQQPPVYHQQQQQGPPPQQYYNPPPQQQQPPPHQQLPHPQVQQHQPPPQQQLPPTAPPVIPPGQKILVNPHFKNNLGTIWNGISSWNQQNPSQQVQQPSDQQYGQQRDWEGSNQDYYQPQGASQTYNQYTDNQYYQPPQDQYYQQNPPPPQAYPQQPPPSGPPPQQTSSWDGNGNNSYYPPAGPPNQFNAPPDQVNPHPQGPPGYPPPGPMGPPPPGPPPLGPPPGPRGPPPFMGPGGGPPPMRGPAPPRGRGGMHVNPNMMGTPRKMMRMQHPNQQQAPGPGVGNVRMRLNTNRPNFPQNKKFGNNFNNLNQGNKFRQNQNQTQVPNKLFPKQQRGDVLKKLKPSSVNIVPIKTEDLIPVVPPELISRLKLKFRGQQDEDDETKAYRKKIEEQKKMREDLLRQKEERRKVSAQQKLQQIEEGGTQSGGTGTSQGDPGTTTYKTVRIMQSDGTTVLRKLTLAQIARLKKITPGNSAAKQPAKKEELVSKVVSVENLSASTSHRQLLDMARTVGVVESVKCNSETKKAIIRFTSVDTAQAFVRRNHRKMVDLSMIQVALVPDPQAAPKPT